MTAIPFTIDVPQDDLDDLGARLARTRLPNCPAGVTSPGIAPELVDQLLARWRDGFDWRAAEARLNTLHQQLTEVDGLTVHYIHQRAASGSAGVPVVLLHGWPDTFAGQRRLVPALAAAGHDVVAPSLLGFGWSDQPSGALDTASVANAVHGVMTALGYDRYAVHGGDFGGAVAEQVARAHPEAVVALHLLDVPFEHFFALDRSGLSAAEQAFVERADAWAENAAYVAVQTSQPLTLAYALSDSPVGLLAWLSEKYAAWSDAEPDLDEVLTHVCLYWFSNTIFSSLRLYSDGVAAWDDAGWTDDASSPQAQADRAWGEQDGWFATTKVEVPTAFAIHPADILVPPRDYAERFFNVQRFTLMPRGGHFAAREQPEALSEDIAAFLDDRR